MAKYSDAWLASFQFVEDPDRFTVHTPPDPGHGDLSEADQATIQTDAPVAAPMGEVFGDFQFENAHMLRPSDKIDNTPFGGGTGPWNAEQAGHGLGGTTRIGATEAQRAYFRGIDHGAAKRGTSDTQPHDPHGAFWHEQRFTAIAEGIRTTPLGATSSHAVYVRGVNSNSANDGDSGRPDAWAVNAPSWKTGRYQWERIDRLFQPPTLTHDNVRFSPNRIVTFIGDTPPPEKSTKYDSPFSSLQKFLPKSLPVGGIRRQPSPWYEGAVVEQRRILPQRNFGGVEVVN